MDSKQILIIIILIVLVILGILYSFLQWEECIKNGFTRFYCVKHAFG